MIALVIFLLLIAAAGYVTYKGMYKIPPGKIGVQVRHFAPAQPGEFSNRVSVRGGPGPQAEILRGNAYHFRLPLLYDIEIVDQTFIKPRTIGLVYAKAGRIAPAGTAIAPFTECDHFQDGAAFLARGGYQGPQMQVLTNGHYDINPHVFDVITVDNVDRQSTLDLRPEDLRDTEIKVGETGVVITHLGESGTREAPDVAPVVNGHNHFQQPWAFLAGGGRLGVQSETLPSGGRYAINPLFAHVVKIPSRNIVLEWSEAAKKASNLDASLEQIELDVQGYTVRLNMKQTLRIPEQAAPGLVRLFGDQGTQGTQGTPGTAGQPTPVQQFVEKELATTVTAYFRRISAHTKILEFMTKYDEIGSELSQEVRTALATRGIEAVTTSLDDFRCEPDDMDGLRRGIAIERHRVEELNARLSNASIEADIEKTNLEVEATRRRLELVQIEGLVELLGPAQVATERILSEWAKMGIPQTIAVGGNDAVASSILQAMPFSQARDMLLALATESGKQLGGQASAAQQEALNGSEAQ